MALTKETPIQRGQQVAEPKSSKDVREERKKQNRELASSPDPVNQYKPRKVVPADLSKPKGLSILNHGFKGVGKTFVSLLTPGTKTILSFDNVSDDTTAAYYDAGLADVLGEAVVYQEHMDEFDASEDNWRETGTQCLANTLGLLHELQHADEKPDIIIIDGSQFLGEISEAAMRLKFKVGKYESFDNLGYWKFRKEKLLQVLQYTERIAKRAVIFTAYVDKENKIPKYTGIIEERMLVVNRLDTVLMRDQDGIPNGMRRNLNVLSSKRPKFLMTGDNFDLGDDAGRFAYANTFNRYWGLDEVRQVR